MKQFFQEVWLSFQPKQYYRFVQVGSAPNKWSFFVLVVLLYTILTASLVFNQARIVARDIMAQAESAIRTWPTTTEFVFHNSQLTIKDLPQPYQQTIVGPNNQSWLLRLDSASDSPRLDGFGLLVTKTGIKLQSPTTVQTVAWPPVKDQTITFAQLQNLVSGGWRVSLWLGGIILFLVLAVILSIFWLAYVWFWGWVLARPAKKIGLKLPVGEMVTILTHIIVIPMSLTLLFRLLPLGQLIPFLPTVAALIFWLAVIKAWPQVTLPTATEVQAEQSSSTMSKIN